MLPTIETATRELYRAGQFAFDAEDATVTVTKDTTRGIQSVAVYNYRNHEQACDAAWRMASKQLAPSLRS